MKNKTLLLVTFFLSITVLFTLFLIINKLKQKKNSNFNNSIITPVLSELNTYMSPRKQFYFNYPSSFILEEKDNTILLKKGKDTIIFNKIGTNYTDVTSYLNYLEMMNHLNIVDRIEVNINGIKSIKALVKSNIPDTTAYYFYTTEWTIYSFSTNSPILKEDLDKIAHSFKYIQ